MASRGEREVFSLRFGNNYTINEISELIGISQSSVKTYLYRALGKARRYLADWRAA
jgi:RNA polymerase sigma factor (sigma-70 family)